MSSPPTIRIRPIQPSDKETWLNLWAQYNTFYKRTIADNVTEVTFNRFLDAQNPISCAVAVADSDSQPIGFATYYPHPSTASIDPNFYLHDLFVDPASRAGGTGEKLIDFVTEKAREAGAYQLYWHTQVWSDGLLRVWEDFADMKCSISTTVLRDCTPKLARGRTWCCGRRGCRAWDSINGTLRSIGDVQRSFG
jgi:GNAT superfamily N-acetyltransferase